MNKVSFLAIACAIASSSCTGEAGDDGFPGADGRDGADGERGLPGAPGARGEDGRDGEDGRNGANGQPAADGEDGRDGDPGEDGERGPQGPPGDRSRPPLSSVVAISASEDLGAMVRANVDAIARGEREPGDGFPLEVASTDDVRAIEGTRSNVVVRWLDPLTYAEDGPRFGANADFIAYFGEGWDDGSGRAPQFHGSGSAAFIWVNHEYVSGTAPTTTSAPLGQHLTLAQHLRASGVLENDVMGDIWEQKDIDVYIAALRREVGGSWLRIVRDPASGAWSVDRGATALRYDATSNTRTLLTGITPLAQDHADDGSALPTNVISGIMGDCSGGQTPWGTVVSAEENVQDFVGDLEYAWSSKQKLVSGSGFDPGALITFDGTPSTSAEFGRGSDARQRHARDLFGYLVEIDPGASPDATYADGVGHRKLGVMGRARWENATFAVDEDRALIAGEPIVVYGGDDRRGGRIYKLVSRSNYEAGMSRAEIRALLDDATLFVAHFDGLDDATGNTMLATSAAPSASAPGIGRWIELSLTSDDVAPNAAALGDPGRTVGEALSDLDWNGMGGFATDDDVRRALFSAANKIGVMELNRPEDLEWNPRDPSGTPTLYVAFTNHGRQVALRQDGTLYDPATHDAEAPTRPDSVGSIFAIVEADPSRPGNSTTFAFAQVWRGSRGRGLYDAANCDNLAIDRDGGVWFGTDGNFGTNGHADAIYYLDLDPSHAGLSTYGRAFRVVAVPSDAEATGPAFSSDMRTLFVSVQHPGENVASTFPRDR